MVSRFFKQDFHLMFLVVAALLRDYAAAPCAQELIQTRWLSAVAAHNDDAGAFAVTVSEYCPPVAQWYEKFDSEEALQLRRDSPTFVQFFEALSSMADNASESGLVSVKTSVVDDIDLMDFV